MTSPLIETSLRIDDVNLADPDFWLRDDTEAVMALLRKERPVAWHAHPEVGRGFWSVMRHADVNCVFGNSTEFSSRESNRLHHDPDSGLERPATGSMAELDPPEHLGRRRLFSQPFTPRAISEIAEDIAEVAARVIGSLPSGEVIDFVEVASKLPMDVICNMLGVPQSDREHIYALSGKAMGDQDPDVGGPPERGAEATAELKAYGRALAQERRRSPRDDLFSRTTQVEVNGDRLSIDELGTYFSLLSVAGNETTATAMNLGVLAFCQFPDEQERFRRDRKRHEATMVEEVLRHATPTRSVRRVATQDLELGGQRIRAGDKIAIWFSSANRDEEVFAEPHRFDIGRKPNPHLAFGGKGPHFCLGASLARREIGIMFSTLFEEFHHVELAGEPKMLRSTMFRGVKRLPVMLSR